MKSRSSGWTRSSFPAASRGVPRGPGPALLTPTVPPAPAVATPRWLEPAREAEADRPGQAIGSWGVGSEEALARERDNWQPDDMPTPEPEPSAMSRAIVNVLGVFHAVAKAVTLTACALVMLAFLALPSTPVFCLLLIAYIFVLACQPRHRPARHSWREM